MSSRQPATAKIASASAAHSRRSRSKTLATIARDSDDPRASRASDAAQVVPRAATSQATRNPASELVSANVASGSVLCKRSSNRARSGEPLGKTWPSASCITRVGIGGIGGPIGRQADEHLVKAKRADHHGQSEHHGGQRPSFGGGAHQLPREEIDEPQTDPFPEHVDRIARIAVVDAIERARRAHRHQRGRRRRRPRPDGRVSAPCTAAHNRIAGGQHQQQHVEAQAIAEPRNPFAGHQRPRHADRRQSGQQPGPQRSSPPVAAAACLARLAAPFESFAFMKRPEQVLEMHCQRRRRACLAGDSRARATTASTWVKSYGNRDFRSAVVSRIAITLNRQAITSITIAAPATFT